MEEQDQKEKDEKEKERRQKIYNTAIQGATALSNGIFTLQNASIERRKKVELDSLQAQFDAGKITQEKLDEERLKIEKAAFKRKKRLDTAQAVINGALGITQSFAQLGPIGGIAGAAIVALQTGLQVAAIQAQTFADGGFTGDGKGFGKDHTGHEVAGIVHKNEYVVPEKVLSTPEGSAMVNSLESMRVGSPSINKLNRFVKGGFTSSNSTKIDTTGLSQEISKSVAMSINNLKVVNVASETQEINNNALEVQNLSTF